MSSGVGDDDDRTGVGGDDACWLDRVCDRCGGFVDDGIDHVCRPSATVRRPTEPECPIT